MFSFPLTTKAYYCDYEDYKEVQKKASNVNIMIDYEIINDEALFTITLYNIKEDQYIFDTKSKTTYNYSGSDTIKVQVREPDVYSFEIYSYDNYCDDNYLNKLFAEIPRYNKYYKDKLCTGIENFKYCQKWFGTSITYDEFKKGVAEYKKNLNEEIVEEEEYKSIQEYILEFYLKYWYIILPIIIVSCLIGIILKRKQENKFNL